MITTNETKKLVLAMNKFGEYLSYNNSSNTYIGYAIIALSQCLTWHLFENSSIAYHQPTQKKGHKKANNYLSITQNTMPHKL